MLLDYRLLEAIKTDIASDIDDALKEGASIHARDLDGSSALKLASKLHTNEVARLLVKHGANVHERFGIRNDSLLHHAARTGNFGFASILIDGGLNTNVQNSIGQTALHLAAKNGYAYLVRYLIEREASPNLKDKRGNSPLHAAAIHGQLEVLNILLRKGADLLAVNNRGYTALHEAAAHGQTAIAKQLIDKEISSFSDSIDKPRPARLIAEQNGFHETAAAIAFAENTMPYGSTTASLSHNRSNPNHEGFGR